MSINESYHTQHAPLGAFASFTVGLVDAPGGFGQSLRGPARQNIYVGYHLAGNSWTLLPFFIPTTSHASAYTGEAAATTASETATTDRPRSLRPEHYIRRLRWASDLWESGDFKFGLRSPFSKILDAAALPESEARLHFAPVVCGFIEYDNSAGSAPVELIFGISEPDAQLRPLDQSCPALAGFGGGTSFGFATSPSAAVSLRQSFSLFTPNPEDHRGLHLLGTEAALIFTVPAGANAKFPLALAFFQPGLVTTGIASAYAYTLWFSSCEAVLRHGLEHHARYTEMAEERDAELAASRLNEDQKFLLAQASHSYRGSSQLLARTDDQGLLWNVNEGEYRMINTFDLTVDHLFFELDWHPWAVRNALDLFLERYSYVDQVRSPDGTTGPGGLSFTHDMGVMNHFTAPGYSSYECDNLTGCFSHMTMEQLLNWVLTAVTYAWRTEDWTWLKRNHAALIRCVESLENRDHPDSAQRDGLLKCDSLRCGRGSEITTYDSLDVSLGQARNNLYLAVKTLGAWLLLDRAFDRLDDPINGQRARWAGTRLTQTLLSHFERDTGFFPAVFEHGNRSRILPAVEGLVYPLYLGFDDAFKPLRPLLDCLRTHLSGALRRGVCIDQTSGGWKLSSTSKNTWFSKIAIAQYVARHLFPDTLNAEAKAADRVHADWQRQSGCGAFAMCDQIFSDTGATCGSRYYPRGVTACLWLKEESPRRRNDQ